MNYIIIYLEIEHLLNFLTQEEKGDFLDLLISYGKTQKLPEIENKKLLNVFNFMKGRLDTQFEKAKIKAQTAKKNGANGGRPTKDKKPKANPTKPNKTQSVFSKPAVEEIRSYCLERKNNINAENFFDYYEARGWKLKTGIIKDWKACVRTWEKNNYNNNQQLKQTFLTKQQIEEQRDLEIYSNLTKKYGGENA